MQLYHGLGRTPISGMARCARVYRVESVLPPIYRLMRSPAGPFSLCRSLNGLGLWGQLPLTPQIWGGLSTLTSLNLGNNKLTGYLPSDISELTQLRSLDMSNNDFNGALTCVYHEVRLQHTNSAAITSAVRTSFCTTRIGL